MPGLIGRTPFVGRQRELATLLRCLDAAARGQGRLVLVAGEPGIGKTRLLSEFAEHAKVEGWQVLAGRAYDTEGVPPYLPFTEALRDYVRVAPLDDLQALLAEAGPEVALVAPEVRRRLPDLASAPATTPEEQRYRLFESVCDFLLGIPGRSEARGPILILDDLHWAEQSTVLLLQHLARRLTGAPLLLVLAYRPVELGRGHPLGALLAELRRSGVSQRLQLGPLTAAEIGALVQELMGGAAAAALVEAIERQTEGNPFFVGEVVQDLLAKELDLRMPEAAATVLGVPEGVREVIERRLERLSAVANDLLRMAAIVGDGFGFEELQAMAGDGNPKLLDALDESIAAGMLREANEGYQFSHALIRQTVHDGLTLARRQRLHLQAAEALERVHAGNLGPYVAALAVHYRLAGGQGEKALAYSERAAERALASYAYEAAAWHLEQALQAQEILDPNDKAKRCDLLLALAEALLPAGEPLRVVEVIAPEAVALAEQIGDRQRASRACQVAFEGITRARGAGSRTTPSFRYWAEAADRYAAPASSDRVSADAAMGAMAYFQDQQWRGWERIQRAMALARRIDDREGLYRAASLIVNWSWAPEQEQDRYRLAEELFVQQQAGVSSATWGFFLRGCCRVFLARGEWDRSEAAMRQVREIAERTRDIQLSMGALGHDITRLVLDGQLEEAVTASETLRQRAEELGVPGFGIELAWRETFWALLHLGRPDQALAGMPEDARTAAVEGRSRHYGSHVALCLGCQGRWPEAQALFEQLQVWLRSTGDSANLTTSEHVRYLAMAILARDRELAAGLREGLTHVASLIVSDYPTVIARHLGAAAALLGEREAARRYYEQALAVAGKLRFRPEIALTHLGMAELLLDERDLTPGPSPTRRGEKDDGSVGARHAVPAPSDAQRNEALQHLDFALSELREMGMQPALERALQVAERASKPGTVRHVAVAAYPDGLSEREVEVLRLVAAGMSNQTIADTLMISLSTVLHHMTHIFTKTDSANRAEAVTYAHRNGLIED